MQEDISERRQQIRRATERIKASSAFTRAIMDSMLNWADGFAFTFKQKVFSIRPPNLDWLNQLYFHGFPALAVPHHKSPAMLTQHRFIPQQRRAPLFPEPEEEDEDG